MAVIEGQFLAPGVSSTLMPQPRDSSRAGDTAEYNISLGAGTGTVQLQRSYDNGVTWFVVEEYSTLPIEKIGREPEAGVLIRFECTVFTAGPIDFRLGT